MTKPLDLLVMGSAAFVFVAGTGLGMKLAFSSPDTGPVEPNCNVVRVERGETLTSNLVTVNVYNTSDRAGLANRVKINLERRGFLGGATGNSPGKAKATNVTILAADPADPKVKLVSTQFQGKVDVVNPDFETEPGVTVLLGQEFRGLKKDAPNSVEASRNVSVCVPKIDLD